MHTRQLLPIFLITLSLVILLPQVHGGSTIQFKSKSTNTGSNTTSENVGPLSVGLGDALVINIYQIGSPRTFTVTDTQSNTYTNRIQSTTTSGSGPDTFIFTAIASSTGSDTVTVAASSGVIYMETFLDYSGVNSFGATSSDQQDAGGITGTSSVALSNVGQNSWIIENVFFDTSAISGGLSFNNGQILRDTFGGTFCAVNGAPSSCNSADRPAPSSSFTLSESWSVPNCGNSPGCLISHSALELVGGQISNNPSVTACYGECGNPPITLINPNATHTINFNQSYTLFYEFQSNLNGVLLNVTTNIAKPYATGNQIGLGVYTASCPVGVSPFTVSCAGQLQPGALSTPFSVGKGRFSIATNTPVIPGQWIGIAVSAFFSGTDLNETNGICGDSTSGICVNGMQYTTGFIPQIISSSKGCTTSNSPCNVAGISSTGLWSWISGNIVVGIPPPTPSSGCINSDLACFLVASACGLSPSNCFIGGSVILFIYFVAFVVGITLCVSYANREYQMQIHIPPSLFFLFFLIELFTFAALGLVPQAIAIVVFVFAALGIAGYFGSAFMGRSNRNE